MYEIDYISVVLKHILIILFFLPFVVLSQNKENAFNLIFNAGLSPAQVHGDAYSGFNKVGVIGGLGVQNTINKQHSLSLSFWFIQKGAQKNPKPDKGDYNAYYLNLNYLEVPFLYTYTQQKYLFDVGLSAGYLINYYEADQNMNYTGKFPFEKFEYSVKIGLGYKINEKWFVNFRSSNSFITIRPNRTKQAIYYNNILARTFNKGYYNNILEFTIGYKIIPNKKSDQ